MNLAQLFTTPIYENNIIDPKVNFEFDDVINSLKQNNEFQLNKATECQLLSDTTFTENLFDTNKLNVFKANLEENVRTH